MDKNKAFSLRQAAQKINIHHVTLRRWIRDGEGPRAFVKRGRRRSTYRILPSDLDAFLRKHTRGGK